MSTITRVRFWKDPGFLEGALEAPSVSYTLPTPSYTLSDDLNPSRDRMFSELRVPIAFEDAYEFSYLEAVYDMNNGDDVTIYGFIDDVRVSSDSPGQPSTVIVWHIDQWFTFLSRAEFGRGLVRKRRPSSGWANDPPNPVPYRFRVVSKRTDAVVPIYDSWWVLLTLVEKEDNVTYIKRTAFPVDVDDPDRQFNVTGREWNTTSTDEITKLAPSFRMVVAGVVDEYLGIAPSTCVSMFISPIPPARVTWSTTNQNFKMEGFAVEERGPIPVGGMPFGAFVTSNPYTPYEPGKLLGAGPQDLTTNEQEVVVTGFDGEVVGTVPWGFRFETCPSRVVWDSSAAYLQIRLDSLESHSEGLCFTIPLPPLQMTENSWSDYSYTGQRSADIQQRVLDVATGGVSSMLSSMQAGAFGAAQRDFPNWKEGDEVSYDVGKARVTRFLSAEEAAEMNAANRVEFRNALKMTAKIGAGIAGAGMIADGLANVAGQMIQDNKVQSQPNNLIMGGTGFDFLTKGSVPQLMYLVPDDYSKGLWSSARQFFGIDVTEPEADCTSLCRGTGPLRIESLIVLGDIPNSAKQYIKQRFNAGVRLI